MAASILRDHHVDDIGFCNYVVAHMGNRGDHPLMWRSRQFTHQFSGCGGRKTRAFSGYSCLEDLESCLDVNLVKPTGIITAKISQKSNTGSNNEATVGTTNASPTLPTMLKLCLGIEQRMGYRASVICSQTIVWLFVLPSRPWEA